MSGVDPEILGITLELAVAYIESGVLKFKDFAREVKIATEELWSKAREYSFLAWNKIQMDPAYEHLGVEDVSATQAKKILAEIDAEDSTPDKNDKPNRPDAPPPAPEPKEVKNKLQVPNKPRSRLASGDNLVPVNLAEAFQDAFNAFEEKHGDIDEYVAKNLDYSSPEDMVDQQGRPIFSAEQVDALGLFFSAAEEGKGIVVADQTGVGKGRVAAGAIHYGVKNGLIPIFVTEKANLFTDIYRDLNAINQGGLRPFIINNDGGVMKDADGNIVYRHAKDSEFKAVMSRLENGDLSDFGPTGKYDYIAVTYSQFAGDKPHHKSKVKALTNMAGRALPIFDEAHNAAGDESWQNSNAMLMADHGNAGATLYLSATWAKRPENLKFFYRTDLGEGGSADDIQTALSHGGAVMQEMVTLSLAKSGQYLRREQSFDGIPFDEFKTADDSKKKDEEHDAEEVMTAIRAIVDFSSKVMQWVADTNGQIDTSNGPVTVSTNGVQHVAGTLSATEQFSIIHNYVAQFLAAMKSRSVAKRAIEHLREGKKVVIGVQNTMESMIDEMIAEDGFKIGEQFPSTYKNLLERVLQKCLVVKGTSPFGKNKRVSIKISLDDLGPVGKAEYYRTLDIIKGLEIAELPFSPIDAIRTDVEKAGFKTAEITGRDYRIDYSKPMPTLENREDSAKSKRTDIIRGFNSGNTDLVIINQAGATGVSMHAGRDFTDQRKRHMIILQSHPDIAVFMQMLGRIHRKGQIASVEAATSRIEEVSDVPAVYGLPSFELATSTLDMERRPAAVLKRKMKSLNAQTSSSQEGHQEIEGVDIINKYGDEIVFSWLHENPDIARAIGLGNLDSREDVARKATGRIAIMPIEVQKIFWQDVGTEYERRIAFLDEIGQNELNPVTVDAKATTIDRTKIYGEEGGSTFAQPVYLEYVEMRTNGKPTRLSEAYKSVVRLEQSVIDKQIQAAKKYIDEMEVKTKQDEALGKPTTFKPNIARTGLKRVENMIHSLKPGTIGFFRTGESDDLGIDIPAVITEVTMPTVKEGVHPFRPSDIMVKIKTADAKGKWTIPLSYLQSKFIMTPQSQKAKFESEYQKEYEASKVALERRYLLSGNLIMARTVFSGGGKVIRFSRADGQVDYAWLTPLSFKPQDNLVSPDVALRSEDEVAARYGQTVFDDSKNEVVITEDGLIKIRKGRIGNAILGDPEVRRILVGRTDVDIATAESDKFSIGTGMQLKSIKGKFFTLDFGREKTIEVMKKIFHILRRMGVGMKTFGGEKPNINNRPTGSVSTMPGSQRPSAGASAYDRLTGKPKNNTSFDVEAAIIRMFDDLDANMGGSKIKWDVRKSTASDPANSSGRFNPNTNTITIFTDRIDNEYELAMVLAHEVVGHAMFKELFGKHLASIASVIERTLPPRVVEDIRARYGARGENVVLHELVAALAERNMGEPTLWEKITAVFNRAMRALGITTEFSASEIKWMLADMKRKAFGTPSLSDLAAKLRGKPATKPAPRVKNAAEAIRALAPKAEPKEAYDIILPRDRGTDPDDGPGKGRRQTETPEFDPDTNDTLDSLKSTLSPEERAVMGEQTQGRAFGEKDANEEPFVESAVKAIDSILLKTGSELSRNRKVFEIAKQANPKNARSIEEWERIRQTMIRSQEADALDEQLAKHIRDDNFRAHAWVRGALGRLGDSISEEMRDWVMRKVRRVLMPFLMKDSHERLLARIAERMYWNGTAMVPTPGFRTQTVDGAYHYREDKITADMAQAAFDALPQQWKDLLTERAKENEEYRQHFVTVAIPAKLAEASMVVVRDSMRLMGKADQKAIDRFSKALSAVYGMDESDLESVGITEDKLTVWKAILEDAQKGGGKATKLDAATAEIMRKKLGEAEKLIRGLETDRGHYGYMHRTGFDARVDPKLLDEANEFIHPWFVNIAASEKKRAGGAGYVENLFVADLAERRGRIEADENNAWMRRIEDMAQPIDYEDAEGKIQRIQDQDELDDVSGAPGEFDIRHLVKAKFGKYAGRMVFIPAEAYDRYKAILEPASADYQIKEVKGLMDAFNRWVNLINLTLLSYPAKMMRDLGAAPFHVVDFIVHWGISHPEDIQHMPDMLWNSFKTMFKPEAWNRMRKERLGEYSESLGFLNEEDKKHYITEALDGIGSKWGNLPIGSVISAIIGEVDMAGAGDIPIKRFFLTMGDQLAARRKLDGADRERFIRRVVSEYGFETSDLTPLLNYLRGKDPNATSKALGTIQKATLPFFGYAFTLAKRMLIDPVNKGALGRGEKLEGFDETTGKSRWATGLRPMFWLAVAYAVSKGILGNDDEDEGAALALSGRPNLKAEVRSAGRVLLSKDENPDGGEYYMSVKGYAHPSMAKVVYDWAHGRAHLGDIWTEMSTVHPVAQMVAGLFGLESAYSRGEDMGARLGRFTALAALPQFTRVGQDLAKVWRLVSGDDSIPDTKKASFLQAFGQFFGISEIPAQLDTDHEKRKMNPVLEAVKALGVNVKYIPYSAIADEANREAKGIEDAADRLKKLKEWQKNSNFRVSRKQTGPADEQEVLSRLGLRSYGSVQEAIDHLDREVAGERMSGLKKALQNLPIGSEKRVDPELRKYMKK